MYYRRPFSQPLMALLLALGCSKPAPPESPTPPLETVEPVPSVTPALGARKNTSRPMHVYFGDTHVHTGLSMHAAMSGATTTPEVAYRFARGEEVTASKGSKAKLDKPLDFLVVADASDNLGFFELLRQGAPRILSHDKARQWHEALKKGGFHASQALADLAKTYAAGKFPKELELTPEETRPAWELMLTTADKYNEPGKFSAFIGYEWSGSSQARSLHRVVMFKDGADKVGQILPLSTRQVDTPEKLWEALAEYERQTGGSVLSIPHSANLSNGQMFALVRQDGKPIDAGYAELRQRFEPLYEVTQIKGNSEAHARLSPDDEFANYETWDRGNLDLSTPTTDEELKGDYAREALKTGLKAAQELGKNPFRFGMIGSTDSYTGLATAEDDNFFGATSAYEPDKYRLRHPVIQGKAGEFKAWQMSASGYAAVWATENTREAIFEAMRRRETYATTGPRMRVRFFGAWDFSTTDLEGKWQEQAYERGVPMGGDLGSAPDGRSPTFLVFAAKDPDGANLDRIQIVKGWVDKAGATHEKVFDVVWSGARQRDAAGKLPSVGNSVNAREATYDNSIGAPKLAKVWMDPEYDPSLRAFYYARVFEIPTPRWTTYDVKRFTVWLGKEVPVATQERAYTSPIWVDPR